MAGLRRAAPRGLDPDAPASVYDFRGIPYAAPPVGDLRWRAPRPAEGWEGIRPATRFGARSPQVDLFAPDPSAPPKDEDCLTLNVTTPELGAAGLPVMVWIHGGAYFAGSSSETVYDGARLAVDGVVVVTLNYRLGAFGYLDLSWLGSPGFETNLGQRDQLAALAWVQRNISAFGGDPARVTVFGESAGGGAITTHLATPAAEGLFRAAIVESSPVSSVYSPDDARGFAERFLDLVGERDPHALRGLDAERIATATSELVDANARERPGTLATAPVVDGDLVPEHPLDAFAGGRSHPVPLVIGTNRNESALFAWMRSPLLPVDAPTIERMLDGAGVADPDRITGAYPGWPSRRAAMRVSTDAAFTMPTLWAATGHSRVAPTWVYRFDYGPPVLTALHLDAVHASELGFVWGDPKGLTILPPRVPLGGTRSSARVSVALRRRWLGFARDQDPGAGPGHPAWPRFEPVHRATLVIDRVDRVRADPNGAQRVAWGPDPITFR